MHPALSFQLRRCASRRPCRSQRLRRAYVWAATVWFALATSGVPLPAGVQARFGSPFPCQMHACGCDSAAACWADCCCFTREEKLAWARRHGATPPAGTPTFDPSAKKIAKDGKKSSAKPACCDDSPQSSPPSLAAPARSCCSVATSDGEPACCRTEQDEKVDDDGTSPAGVVLVQALKCKGVASSWFGGGEPFVPPPAVEPPVAACASEALASRPERYAARRLCYVGPPG